MPPTATTTPPARPCPVTLSGSGREWAALPPAIRTNAHRLQLARIAALHRAVSAAAGLEMPATEILPFGWPLDADGAAVFVRAAGPWRIELPTPTLHTEDDGLLRLLLVAGFYDCVRRSVRALTRADGELGATHALLRPVLWFGDKDVTDLEDAARWAGRLAAASDFYRWNWLDAGLPAKVPGDVAAVEREDVPYEVRKRIESLG